MAVLTDSDRKEIWAEFMESMEKHSETTSLLKGELRAAFDAADTWVSDNASAFNSALPQPARGALTSSQKARLLMLVVRQRFVKGV